MPVGGVSLLNPGAAGGAAKLGNLVAGGGEASAAMAGARSMYMGAQTADAIAQARQRQSDAAGRETLASELEDRESPLVQALGITPNEANLGAASLRAGEKVGDVVEKVTKLHQQNVLGNPLLSAAERHGAGFVLDPATAAPHAEGVNGTYIDPLEAGTNPAGPVHVGPLQQSLTQSEIGEHNAAAGLKTQEATHPELFHPNAMTANNFGKIGDMTDPTWAAHVNAVAAGDIAPTPPGSRFYGILGGPEQRDVKTVNPNFKGYQYNAAAREASTVEGGQQGITTDMGINRVGQHLNVMSGLIQDLDNGQTQPGNKVINYFKTVLGQEAPTNMILAGHVLGTEIVKSMANVNAGSKEEREALANQFSTANSVDQLNGAMHTAAHLVKAQADGRAIQWKNATGRDEYYQRNLLGSTRRALGVSEGARVDNADAPGGPAPGTTPPTGGGLPSINAIDAELARRQDK